MDIKPITPPGIELEPCLRNAKYRIVVFSPWIDPEYMKLLIDKNEPGVHVCIITRPDVSNRKHRESLMLLCDYVVPMLREISKICTELTYLNNEIESRINDVHKSLTEFEYAKKSLEMSMAGHKKIHDYEILKQYYEKALNAYITSIEKLSNLEKEYDKKYRKVVKLLQKIPYLVLNERVHLKIYVVDNRVYTGSANLTKAGLWDNYEFLIPINLRAVLPFLELFAVLKRPKLQKLENYEKLMIKLGKVDSQINFDIIRRVFALDEVR